jgi:hypothetical protein
MKNYNQIGTTFWADGFVPANLIPEKFCGRQRMQPSI